MADIFISYANQDRRRVLQLVRALEAQSWSVFWDTGISGGGRWDDGLRQALEEARCVVVVLTKAAVASPSLKREVAQARDQGSVMLPLLLDAVDILPGLASVQAADLSGWDGDPGDPRLTRLIAQLRRILAEERRERTDSGVQPESAVLSVQSAQHRVSSSEPRIGAQSRNTAQTSALGSWRRRFSRAAGLVPQLGALGLMLAGATLLTQAGLSRLGVAPGEQASAPCAHVPGEGPEMVVIPGGSFEMGDTQGTGNRDEEPVHRVGVRAFAIGRCEVTFEEYDAFAKATNRELPSDEGWGRGKRPVMRVSWEDAAAYAQWLTEQTGKRYRLPTEAEWEYVARAGTATDYWWGDDIRQDGKVWANCADCGSEWDNKQTAPVGSFAANPFGLFDTAGNVWEWVQDCWHESYAGAPNDGSAWLEADGGDCALRVYRGGSWRWYGDPGDLRAAFRGRHVAAARGGFLGFRLAQDL